MKTLYRVKFSKWFVDEKRAGLMIDDLLTFPSLDLACAYVSFCHSHRDKPVVSIEGNYTIHMARIETFDVSPENETDCLKVGRY